MTDTPPDWVLIEAAKRSGIECDAEFLRRYHSYTVHGSFVVLCDMILEREQAVETERAKVVSFLNCSGGEIACNLADWIEAGEHLK